MIIRLTPADSPYTIPHKLLGAQLALQPNLSLWLSGGGGGNITVIFPEISKLQVGQGSVTISFDDADTGIQINTSATDVFAGLGKGQNTLIMNAPLANSFETGEFIADAGSQSGVNRWVIAGFK
jgi:hypothetical protein